MCGKDDVFVSSFETEPLLEQALSVKFVVRWSVSSSSLVREEVDNPEVRRHSLVPSMVRQLVALLDAKQGEGGNRKTCLRSEL